jgi:hypothetical protein
MAIWTRLSGELSGPRCGCHQEPLNTANATSFERGGSDKTELKHDFSGKRIVVPVWQLHDRRGRDTTRDDRGSL